MPFEFGPRLNVSSNFSRAHYPFISVFRFYHRSSSGRALWAGCAVKRVRASRHAPARPAGSESGSGRSPHCGARQRLGSTARAPILGRAPLPLDTRPYPGARIDHPLSTILGRALLPFVETLDHTQLQLPASQDHILYPSYGDYIALL